MFPLVTRLATKSLPPSQRASPVLPARPSTTVPVFSQVWSAWSRWIVTSGSPSAPLVAVRISAHQIPSLNHSLLCGLSSVGDAPAVGNAWSWYIRGTGSAAWALVATTVCTDSSPASRAINGAITRLRLIDSGEGGDARARMEAFRSSDQVRPDGRPDNKGELPAQKGGAPSVTTRRGVATLRDRERTCRSKPRQSNAPERVRSVASGATSGSNDAATCWGLIPVPQPSATGST